MEPEKIEKPEGEGWVQAYGIHWERVVESDPCCYCGCTRMVESTYSWPYCEVCKST